MSKYLVKERHPDGFYRNPYKKGGRAMRWTKWKTVSSHEILEEATKAAIVTVGLACRAVFYKGERISSGPRLEQWWIDEQKRIACERDETTDCPDQHLCRHGIDN
jgi:hypothetical protein